MKKILENLGFSKYKQKAYIALCNLEQATVGEIRKKSKIPSSKIYEVLSWLYESGYISIAIQKPLTYKINNPKSILQSEVKDRISKLKDIELMIKDIALPIEKTDNTNFKIVYGRDAFLKNVKDAVRKSNKEILAIVKHWRSDYELDQLNKEFIKNGGKMKFLGPNSESAKHWKNQGVKVRNYNPEETRFTIWDKKIIAIGFKNKKEYFSLWIENELLGMILANHFNSLWTNSKAKTSPTS